MIFRQSKDFDDPSSYIFIRWYANDLYGFDIAEQTGNGWTDCDDNKTNFRLQLFKGHT